MRPSPIRKPQGGEIFPEVRRGLLTWLRDSGVSPTAVGRVLLRREGYGDWAGLAAGIERNDGPLAAFPLSKALSGVSNRIQAPGVDYAAMPALESVPVVHFLDALEEAAALYHDQVDQLDWDLAEGDGSAFVSEVNRTFLMHGIDFAMTPSGRIDWRGDRGAHAVIIAPALEALAESRLDGARAEFEASLAHLRQGTDKGREDAIEEAAKAVESAMKVVLASLDREDENLTAEPLWNQLKEVGAVEAYTKDAILAASRIRNKRAGHGSGAIPRAIGVAEATLCVSCAASAIAFLATRLNA